MKTIKNKNGFAVSGIIYTILVLFIILVIAILSMFNSRKTTLDKLKEKVLSQIGSSVVVENSSYDPNSQIIEHKITTKGYYKIELMSSNGSTLSSELYLKEGEILYLKVGSKTINNGTSEVYSDKELKNSLIKLTNTNYINQPNYNDRSLLKVTYTKKNQAEANGKILISYIQTERKNNNLNQVRYIKNCINGNNMDSTNKWNEIGAIYRGINVALNKNVKIYDARDTEQTGDFNSIVDNNLNTYYTTESEKYCVVVDLGRTYPLDYIYAWHEYGDKKVYYDDQIYVSTAGVDYNLIYNYETEEINNGIEISAFEISKTKLVDSVFASVKKFDNANWLRIYHHNNLSGTLLWNAKAQLLSESGYDSIHKKSILYFLKDYIKDGKYELLLEYPDISRTKYNRWTQTSDFTLNNKVAGYSGIHIDYSTMNFGGLLLSNSANYIISSTDNTHYAIGTINANGGVNGFDNNLITGSTDLWVRIYE